VAPESPAERAPADAFPIVPGVGRAETIREMNVLEGLLKKRRADIVRSNKVIADAQRQLSVAQKAVDVMEANLCRLAASVGPAASDGELAHGGDRDLASVLGDVRHITETLGKVDRLDHEYKLYAASQAKPLSAAAWIAQELRSHLAGLERFYDAVSSDKGTYQLVKKRRKGGP
jgi:hypothetical protein